MTTIKPFDAGGWFPIHNLVFDVIMPSLSPNGWKILCVAIRQTWGWRAADDPTGMKRREWDRISYSQFQKKAGIGSRATVSKALKECMEARYLLRYQMGTERGQPRYFYSLNRDYEVELPTGTKAEPVMTGTETVPVTSLETVPVTGTETEPTKQRKQTTNKAVVVALTEEQQKASDALTGLRWVGTGKNSARHYATTHDPDQVIGWCAHAEAEGLGAGLVRNMLDAGEPAPAPQDRRRFEQEIPDPAERPPSRRDQAMERYGIDAETMALWEQAQAELRLKMTKANFDKWLTGAMLLQLENGTATLGVANARAVDWLSGGQHAKPIRQTLAGLLGGPVELGFEVLE